MENYIKEGKTGFGFACVSSPSKEVNTNWLMVHGLAYSLLNWVRHIVLVASMRKQRIDKVRLKLIKIAERSVRAVCSKYFKLCSSCPYKQELYETLKNIHRLRPQLK